MEQGEVNAAELQAALRKIVPFFSLDKTELLHVWCEVDGGEVRLTGGDGFQLTQVWFEADWPNGEWLLDGAECKKFAQSADSTLHGDLPLEITDTAIKVNDMVIPVRGRKWMDYRAVLKMAQAGLIAEALFDRRELGKFVRPRGDVLGLTLRDGKCFGVRKEGRDPEERGEETLIATQLVSGDAKAAFDRTRFKKVVDTFGAWITVKFQAESNAPVILEGDHHWHIIMPWSTFPLVSELGKHEHDALTLAQDMIAAILKEDVKASVDLREGRMVIEWGESITATTVRTSENFGVAEVENDSTDSEIPTGESGGDGELSGDPDGGGGGPVESDAEVPSQASTS